MLILKDLRLRRQRRIAGLVATVPTMLCSAIASGSYFMTIEIDPSQTLGGVCSIISLPLD